MKSITTKTKGTIRLSNSFIKLLLQVEEGTGEMVYSLMEKTPNVRVNATFIFKKKIKKVI